MEKKTNNNLNKHTHNPCTNHNLKLKSLVHNSKVNCAQKHLNNFNFTAKHLFINSGKQVRHSIKNMQKQKKNLPFLCYAVFKVFFYSEIMTISYFLEVPSFFSFTFITERNLELYVYGVR